MVDINGTCDPRFDAMRSIMAANIASGADVGASAAVVLDGELVVDIWGGWVDAEHSAPWEENTLTNVWSSTKTMMFLTLLELADRGEISLYDPVHKYWPEFRANGKDDVHQLAEFVVGLDEQGFQVLSHRFPPPFRARCGMSPPL